MPDSDWGVPPWRVDVTLPPAPPPARSAVAVVGAGLTGLTAAYALARRGCEVAVLEAGRVGAGASGRTGGIVLEHTAAGPLPAADQCIPGLARLVREADIDCDLRLGGCWELAHGGDPGSGPLRWRDGATWLRVAEEVAGGTLDPGALLAGLARAARAAGASIHEGARVREITLGRPVTLALEGAVAHAEQVVLALNAYTTALLPGAGGLASALTLALATAPLDAATVTAAGLAARLPFYTQDLPYLWGRLLADGLLVLGAGLVFDPDGDLARVGVGAGEARDALTRLEARLRGFHPALADVRVAARWGGPVAFRGGRAPLVAPHPAARNVILTGAYAGHGVALSVRVGELVAAAIADGRPLPTWGAFAD